MKKSILSLLLGMAALSTAAAQNDKDFVQKELDYCSAQVDRALDELRHADGSYDFTMEPRNILNGDKQKGWNCRPAVAPEWCSGFWPGILWMNYSLHPDNAELLRAAKGYTEALRHIAYEPIFDHDIGFLMFCSYGKGYEQTCNADYKQTILASADSLANLFNPLVGTILSWPREVEPRNWPHNTIMDNMINLDMMLWAAKNGGNRLLADLAVSHAKTTMQNHFRPDGSCYHVAVYDTISGNLIKGVTHQGYADHSMWARGQSWAIYGYTMVYRHTRKPVFLDFAQKVTDIYLKRLGLGDYNAPTDKGDALTKKLKKADLVPAWDFDDPTPKASKDASAACVVADALLELSGFVGGDKGNYYRQAAMATLHQLADKYKSGKQNVSFLLHSTGHHPAGSEIDASIIYADYYYLEALLRARDLLSEE